VTRIARRALTLGVLLACTACSADDVTLSQPTLETPGAFVATQAPGANGFFLLRTVVALKLEGDVVLFMLRYPQMPATIEEARALAQGPALVSTDVQLLLAKDLTLRGYEVVWFRTLTAEGRDVVL
jgi:hypothetical protein